MATGWLRGRVKAVTSGDCLVIVGNVKAGPPPEKTVTLASLLAPRLARRDTRDDPFAWNSREYLRQKCIGQEVVFKIDYAVPSIGREFGSVFLGTTNLALDVVAQGWAKVRAPVPNSSDVSPYLEQLQKAEEQAKEQGVGLWTKTPGASEAAIRTLPPSGVGQDSGFDAAKLLDTHRGLTLAAVVEQVRDGSTVRVFLLPSFQFVQVYVAGVQCPAVGRKLIGEAAAEPAADGAAAASAAANGVAGISLTDGAAAGAAGAGAGGAAPSAAQRLAQSADKEREKGEAVAEPFALEAKHHTEMRTLHREVRVVLEGVDGRYSNLVGSVHYSDAEGNVHNLALELVEMGYARCVEWSANMLEAGAKSSLKAAELEAKRQRLRVWTHFVPPPSNSTAVKDDAFQGKVVEVVSGDCVVVADEALLGSASAERRVNLSSIRARKMGNPKRGDKPEAYAREAKEFLRQRLVGKQVKVTMEYKRKMPTDDGGDGREMAFGTVMLLHPGNMADAHDGAAPAGGAANGAAAGGPQGPLNIAELLVARGFATVVRHRDFEERSAHYEALQAAEARAIKAKKNIHSSKDPPVNNMNDLSLPGLAAKAKTFLPFLQRGRRLAAIVDYVLSGHRFKLLVPRDSCAIAFALSGVRCPAKGEPFSEDAIAFMRRRIMQHDVEIEVETVDRTGTFIGSLWVNRTNAGVMLLEAGLARLHPTFSPERTAEGAALAAAERKARDARTGLWKDFVEGESKEEGEGASAGGALGGARWGAGAAAGAGAGAKQEVMQVQVTEVLGGGRFYTVEATSGLLGRMEEALKALQLGDSKTPAPGTFVPRKQEIVLAQFFADKSWARAMVVATPAEAVPQKNSEYTVLYIDYGNQEPVPFSALRPLSAAGGELPVVPARGDCPGLAQLCQLAHVKVPLLEDDFGIEAATKLQELTAGKTLLLRLEQKDMTGGRVKSQNTGTCWMVTLVDGSATLSVNAALLQEGLARLEKRSVREMQRNATLSAAVDSLREHQEVARKMRLNMWEYGNVESDEEEAPRPRGRF